MKLKKLLASILCIAMLLSTMSFTTFAADVSVATAEEFATAIKNANDGDTITVSSAIVGIDVEVTKSITIELDGNTLTNSHFKIETATVTIQNGTIENETSRAATVGFMSAANKASTLSLSNVNITTGSAMGIWVCNGSTLDINGGSLNVSSASTSAGNIYGVYAEANTTVNIEDTEISVESTGEPKKSAQAVYGYEGVKVTASESTITTDGGNYSYGIFAGGDVTVNDTDIDTNVNNNDTTHNYAVYSASSASVTGGEITTNGNYSVVVSAKGNIDITGVTSTTNGIGSSLVSADGSGQTVNISGVEFDATVATPLVSGRGADEVVVDENSTLSNVVTGRITGGLVNMSDPEETFLSVEIEDLKANESVVIKTYDQNNVHIATTKLLKPEYYIINAISAKVIITGESGSWETVWEKGKLRADHIPAYGELYVDGYKMNSAQIQMAHTSGEGAVNWAEVPGVPAAPVIGQMPTVFDSADRDNIGVELNNVYAEEEIKVEYYADQSGETLIATTTWAKEYPVVSDNISVNTVISGKASSSWKTEWHKEPSVDYVPTMAVIYIDGEIFFADTIGFQDANMSRTEPITKNMYATLEGVYYAAKFGEDYYGTITEAIDAAEAAGLTEATIEVFDDFKASDIISDIPNVTIVGNDEVTMDVEDKLHVFDNKTYTIKDVIVDGQEAWQGSNSNQPIERGLQYVNMTFESCDISKVLTLYEGTFMFDGCEFTGVDNDYSVYVYASKDVTFKDCVFNAVNKAIKVYSHSSGYLEGGELEISGTKFYASGTDNVKAVVEMDLKQSNTPEYDIDINESIAVGFAEGGAADGKENGNVWYNLEVNDTITEEYIAEKITIEKDEESKAYECGDITVVFEPTAVEGEYDIVLKASEGAEIFEFVGAELAFDKAGSKVESGYENKTMNYNVYGIDGQTTVGLNIGSTANSDTVQVYRIHTIDTVRLSGNRVPIGKIVFDGKGEMKLAVVGSVSKVVTTKYLKDATNDERVYTAEDGARYFLDAGDGINSTASTAKRDVRVNIEFEHDIKADVLEAYKYMTVTLKDSIGSPAITKTVTVEDVNNGYVEFKDNTENGGEDESVTVGVITVTLKAPGFRTYTYQTTMEEGKDENDALVLNFWNSVLRDKEKAIEEGKTAMKHNFLVGDIAMDYIIDKYDLAAVTSYYGIYDIDDSEDVEYIKKHVRYDLNRDGQIDILDVAYVLHGMGN